MAEDRPAIHEVLQPAVFGVELLQMIFHEEAGLPADALAVSSLFQSQGFGEKLFGLLVEATLHLGKVLPQDEPAFRLGFGKILEKSGPPPQAVGLWKAAAAAERLGKHGI